MKMKTKLINFFSNDDVTIGIALKNKTLKKNLIRHLDVLGDLSIPDLAKALNTSIPKIADLVNELIKEGLIRDYGKIESTGGRRANLYGLVSNACYFIGIDVKRYYVNIGLMDFKKNIIRSEEKLPFLLDNSKESLKSLVDIINKFIHTHNIPKFRILGMGINLSGRINNITGYSYSYFNFQEEPLTITIEKETGIKTFIENDSNAMAFGEYHCGIESNCKNLLFINLDYGTGLGIIIDKKLYYGKSGFSGEFGHIPFFDNNIICNCGKKGCMETEISGEALIRKMKEKMKAGATTILTKWNKNPEELKLEDLIEAARHEDLVMIDLLSEMGDLLGKALAVLINLFNPELVILGGTLSETNDYIRLPSKSSLNKFALRLVNNDTQMRLSKLGEKAGVLGACLIARKKILSPDE